MEFMQIIEITTDRIDELATLEDEWRIAGRGRRTGTADWLCADRSQPGRYFSVNLFPSHDAALTNAALPETDALAGEAMKIGAATFYDCDVLQDLWMNELRAQSDRLVEMFTTATLPGLTQAASGPVEVGSSINDVVRSEERRVGKECPQLCRSRWSPYH